MYLVYLCWQRPLSKTPPRWEGSLPDSCDTLMFYCHWPGNWQSLRLPWPDAQGNNEIAVNEAGEKGSQSNANNDVISTQRISLSHARLISSSAFTSYLNR